MIAGCGQKGPLVHPDAPKHKKVVPGPAPPVAPAPAAPAPRAVHRACARDAFAHHACASGGTTGPRPGDDSQPLIGVRAYERGQTHLGRRVFLSVSRLPRPAPAQQFERRADRRSLGRAEHVEQNDQRGGARADRRGLRCTRAHLQRRSLRSVQGASRAHAGRSALAGAALAGRSGRHGVAAAACARGGSGRCHRHSGGAGRRLRLRGPDLDRRQGHGAAGGSADRAHQHHEQHPARSRRRQVEIRCVPRADRRLPRAGRRQFGQYSRHHRRRRQDCRQMVEPISNAGRPDCPCRRCRRQSRREFASGTLHARAVAQARHH